MKSINSSRKKSKHHLKKLEKSFDFNVDALIIENPVNLLYLTGISLSSGNLFVHPKGSHLFVDGRYLEAAKANACTSVSLISEKAIKEWIAKKKIKTLGFDSVSTSYERYQKLKKLTHGICKLEAFPNPLKEMRRLKSIDELAALRKSARLLWKGFQYIKKNVKAGMTEKELARNFEIFCLKNGAEKMAFEPIIAFGVNSALPHHRASNAKIGSNGHLLIDIGVVVDRYHSDMTRIIFFSKIDPQIKKIYTVVENAKKAALALCRPGAKLGELDRAARSVMAQVKMEKYFIHSLGHGVGLEIHEFPRISSKGDDRNVVLEAGMVITIEPGLYLPNIGGVRLEDTIIITKNGYENLYPLKE